MSTLNFLSAHAVTTLATLALRERQPFSVVRLGDGEGRLLAWPDRISRQALDQHLRFWFGHADFTDTQIHVLRAMLVSAIYEADVVGLPNASNAVKNEWWREPERWMRERHIVNEAILCDHELHLQLWQEGLLERVIGEAERVVLVTCRDVLAPFVARFTAPTSAIIIPEEGLTHRAPNAHAQLYNDIRDTVEELTTPGSLWLIGAGVLGKSYAATVRRGGGVALDVGSLFDGWAGVGSRTYLKTGEWGL